MKRLINSNLTKKFFKWLFLFQIPILLMFFFTNYYAFNMARNNKINYSERQTHLLSERIASNFSRYEQISRTLLLDRDINALNQSPEYYSDLTTYERLLTVLQAYLSSFDITGDITVYMPNKKTAEIGRAHV